MSHSGHSPAPPSLNAPVSIDLIDRWLPQTQCTRCGYSGCRAYAEAIASGAADFNRCPPGGNTTIQQLARLLGMTPRPLDPACGAHQPRTVAIIDEERCIGCTKCIRACPVDAVIGARRLMHTVITNECTGCQLCIPLCPVDCIVMVSHRPIEAAGPWPEYSQNEVDRWRRRNEERLQRQARREEEDLPERHRQCTGSAIGSAEREQQRQEIRAEIRAAVARVKAKRVRQVGGHGGSS